MNNVIENFSLKQSKNSFNTIKASVGAGFSIALGGALFAFISAIDSGSIFYKWLGALFFSIGLILIVLLKGQLFTGNVLMTFNMLKKKMGLYSMLENWFLVYLGNFIGSLVFAVFIWSFLNFISFDLALGKKLIAIAETKINQNSSILLFKAIACNILVCLAVYLSIVMKSWLNKIICIIIPITLFVGLGFEHSVANMFLIPTGLLVRGKLNALSTYGLFYNLLWVTIGNIIGGTIVSLFIFIRSESRKNL